MGDENKDSKTKEKGMKSKKELEQTVQKLKHKLKHAHSTITKMKSVLDLQKQRTSQLSEAWKLRLEEGQERIRNIQLARDKEMHNIISKLYLFEGELKREQKEIAHLLHDKDVVIREQQGHIKLLTIANEHFQEVLFANKENSPFVNQNGVKYCQEACDNVEGLLFQKQTYQDATIVSTSNTTLRRSASDVHIKRREKIPISGKPLSGKGSCRQHMRTDSNPDASTLPRSPKSKLGHHKSGTTARPVAIFLDRDFNNYNSQHRSIPKHASHECNKFDSERDIFAEVIQELKDSSTLEYLQSQLGTLLSSPDSPVRSPSLPKTILKPRESPARPRDKSRMMSMPQIGSVQYRGQKLLTFEV